MSQYEVLSPWAEADPISVIGLSPRLMNLAGKKIGLFTLTYKHASARVNGVIEKKLKERFPTATFTYFERNRGADLEEVARSADNDERQNFIRFEDWVTGVDAVIGAVGD